jgi:hypothetical protein
MALLLLGWRCVVGSGSDGQSPRLRSSNVSISRSEAAGADAGGTDAGETGSGAGKVAETGVGTSEVGSAEMGVAEMGVAEMGVERGVAIGADSGAGTDGGLRVDGDAGTGRRERRAEDLVGGTVGTSIVTGAGEVTPAAIAMNSRA